MSSTTGMRGEHDYVPMLASRVRSERKRLGFTQEGFARHIGMDRGYMGGVERGEHDLTFAKLMNVLEGLRATPTEFFRDIRLPHRESGDMRAPSGKSLRRSVSKMKSYSEMLGAAVRYEREVAGVTQEEFAFRAGLARSYLSGIECGTRNPTFTLLMRILEGLGTEPADFFQHFPLPAKGRKPP